jgi:xylulokinase
MWHFMGVMLSAAGSLQWFHDTLAPDESFDDLLAPATDLPPGSEGLLFLPYLTGERTPHPDPLARGAFVGLTVRHTRAHMARAVLEGRLRFEQLQLMAAAGRRREDAGAGERRRREKRIVAAPRRRDWRDPGFHQLDRRRHTVRRC